MQHLAIIPDGNRRWAAQNKLKSFLGHKKGLSAIKSAVSVCLQKKIKYLSIYTFSLENFLRSTDEKKYLFSLIPKEIAKQLPSFIENKIRINFLGDRSLFPENVREAIHNVESETKKFKNLFLNFLFCYGSKQEMVQAVRNLAEKVKNGQLSIEEIDETSISESLWTSGIPDPDLIIRTGYAYRLSNFLLYQSAYSEFLFLNCFWPEVTEAILEKSISSFKKTQRNFGK